MAKKAKPHGRTSAYAFFIQHCRKMHSKKHPGLAVPFIEFSKVCSEKWGRMREKDKAPFQKLSDKDKKRYDKQMVNYKPSEKDKEKKRKKREKKKIKKKGPKRAMCAFFFYCQQARPAIRAKYPGLPMGEIAKALGGKWRNLSNKEKKTFEQMAEKDKGRYVREMKKCAAKKRKTGRK